MSTLRDVDKLICKHVYKEEVEELNQRGGFCVDCKAKTDNSKANEPIYAMDMVHDYRLKHFTTKRQYVFDLIDKINEINKFIEMDQDSKGVWHVSLWDKGATRHLVIKSSKLEQAVALIALHAYGYNKVFALKIEE